MSFKIEHGSWIGRWVAERIGGIYAPESSCAIGLIVRQGPFDVLSAGIIYEDWNGKSVVAHIAIDGQVTREFLSMIAHYAFDTLGVHKVIAPVYSDNTRSLKMVTKMGFVEEARLRDAQAQGDIILFTITKEQCKYLSARYYGKTRQPAACA